MKKLTLPWVDCVCIDNRRTGFLECQLVSCDLYRFIDFIFSYFVSIFYLQVSNEFNSLFFRIFTTQKKKKKGNPELPSEIET